jgi:hypothetical protein
MARGACTAYATQTQTGQKRTKLNVNVSMIRWLASLPTLSLPQLYPHRPKQFHIGNPTAA